MLDQKNRILVPGNFRVVESEGAEEVRFYFDLSVKLFYIYPRKIPGAFLIGITKLGKEKNKITVPEKVVEVYGTKNIFCAERDERIYLIPLKKD